MIETRPRSRDLESALLLLPPSCRSPGAGPWVSGRLSARGYLAHVVVLKERQEAYVAACGDAFEKCDVPIPRIQLHHVVENIGHGLPPGQEQIDKFLLMRERGKACQGEAGNKRKGGEGRKSKENESPDIRGAAPSLPPSPRGSRQLCSSK